MKFGLKLNELNTLIINFSYIWSEKNTSIFSVIIINEYMKYRGIF